jgi:hypothetical protein
MHMLRTVEAEADGSLVLLEEGAPLVINEDAIGLKILADAGLVNTVR